MHFRSWGNKTSLEDIVAFNVKDFLDENSGELWSATKELLVSELPGIASVVENDD